MVKDRSALSTTATADCGELTPSEQRHVLTSTFNKLISSPSTCAENISGSLHLDEFEDRNLPQEIRDLIQEVKKTFALLQNAAELGDIKTLLVDHATDPLTFCMDLAAQAVLASSQKNMVTSSNKAVETCVTSQLQELGVISAEVNRKIEDLEDMIKAQDDMLRPERVAELDATLNVLKDKLDKLRAARTSLRIPDREELKELVKRHKDLLKRKEEVQRKLNKYSANGVLPPHPTEMKRIIREKKDELQKLMEEISSLQASAASTLLDTSG